jgi:hypothetical protein
MTTDSQTPAPVSLWSPILIWSAFMFGIAFGTFLNARPTYLNAQPMILPAKNLFASQMEWSVEPIDILVHFRPPDAVQKTCSSVLHAYACTQYGKQPCEIFLPSGETIIFNPKITRAYWQNPFVDRVFPHELLHCFFPNWHDVASPSDFDP